MKKLLLICALLFTFSLQAQDLKIHKGDFEISGSGDLNQAVMGAEVRFGSFIADYIQLGVDLTYVDTDLLTRFSLGAYSLYMFETQTYALPYAGAKISLSSLEPDGGENESGLDFALLFGLKYYVADNVSLNTEVHVGYSSADTYIDNDKASSSDYGLTIGMSYYW